MQSMKIKAAFIKEKTPFMTCESMFIKSVFLYMHTKLIHKRRNVINKNATKTGASQMFFIGALRKTNMIGIA